MAAPEKAPLVPSLTGSPQLDTALRYGASKLGMAIASASIAWMDAHGFNSASLAKDGIDLGPLIAATVAGVAMAAASWVWGQLSTKWSQAAIVNNTIRAALTGEVPAAIVAKSSEAQARAVEESPRTTIVPTPPPPSPAAKP